MHRLRPRLRRAAPGRRIAPPFRRGAEAPSLRSYEIAFFFVNCRRYEKICPHYDAARYLRGSGRGDQFVTVNVTVPKGLTSSQKELLRQFAASMGELDRAGGSSGSGIFGKKKK